ncbi:TPA: MucB/RseB C-terminal domain-containing protein [Pseudomonas aeruginosa]|nr:MucB/RseB C-terminal domain-containing protein [Pseudomonas aeruginosa]
MRTTSLLLLLGSLMAVPATQAADASDWLNRLAEADRQNSFQGTFVYERNGSFSTHEIWHRVESDGAVRERLLQLDGPAKADGEKAVAWRSEWLPPGFTLTRSFMRRSPVTPDPVACLTYGDGLARFSVFIEPLHGAMVGDARSQLGPTVVVSKRLQTDDGGQMVTVVGEVPLGTAERVALSIRPEAAAQK